MIASEPQLVKASAMPIPINDISAGASGHGSEGAGESKAPSVPVVQSAAIDQSASPPKPSGRAWFPDEATLSRPGEAHGFPQGNRSAQHSGQETRDPHAGANGGAAARPTSPHGGSEHYGEARRTLHLSLPQGNSAGPGAESRPPGVQNAADVGYASERRPGGEAGFAQQPRQGAMNAAQFGPSPNLLGADRGSALTLGESQRAREGGAFIDHALRERIDGDIAAFLAAFDAALDHDTAESRTELREATDRLLRAGARTRIELERLEARVPLPPRDKHPQASPLYRPR
jgi:hypothetical protein